MGKNKKKKAQMFSNFLAFKAGQGSQNTGNRPNVVIVTKPILPTLLGQSKSPAQFQTPHGDGDQDKLAELLDDTSPAPAPRSSLQSEPGLSTSKWRPVEDVTSIQVNIRKDPKRPNLTVVKGSKSRVRPLLDESKTSQSTSHEVWVKVKSQEPLQSSSETPPSTKPHETSPPAPPPASSEASPAAAPAPPAAPAPAEVPAAPPTGVKRRPQWVLAAPPAKQQARPSPRPAPAPLMHKAGSGWPRSMSTPAPADPAPAPAPCAPPALLSVRIAPPDGLEQAPPPQPYSPSDVYSEAIINEEGEESAAAGVEGGRRVSAFQRLGPAPGAGAGAGVGALLAASTHEVVVKYRDLWPHRTPIVPIRVASARTSKSAMLMQTEYMEETYSRDNRFVLVTVTGYPENWTKEDVLDAILESVKGKSFIPCFIEMSGAECKFLVVRCRAALLHIHKYGFVVRGAGGAGAGGGVELVVSLGCIQLTLAQLDFVPRLVLRRLAQLRLAGTRLDLSRFTQEHDVSHFVYFPLWRVSNQAELVALQGAAPWASLTHLDLSHNRITSLSGLELSATCPRLRSLDLGHNRLESAGALLCVRALPLASLVLEGNPLCLDYIQQEHYLAVLRALFPTLLTVDGVAVHRRGTLPTAVRQYSVTQSGAELAERFLSALLLLLARAHDHEARASSALLYHERATLRVTVSPRLRYSDAFVSSACRALFRCGSLSGRGDIARALQRWPPLLHDPAALTLDVIHHEESATLVVVGGVARVGGAGGAGGAGGVFSFSRSVVVRAGEGGALAVHEELLHWDVPARALLDAHTDIEQVKPQSWLSLDDPPDEDLKQKLLTIFMQITELDKMPSQRCLEAKEWNIKNALEYFVTLLKLDDLEPIMKE